MTSGTGVYSYVNFLRTEKNYDTRQFFDQFSLANQNKQIARPATVLAPRHVIDGIFKSPEPLVPQNSPELNADHYMKVNEREIEIVLCRMVEKELEMRITPEERSLASEKQKTPNEMIVETMNEALATATYYIQAIDEKKFDANEMLQGANDVCLKITEMLRQPHNFEKNPDIPPTARLTLNDLVTRVAKIPK